MPVSDLEAEWDSGHGCGELSQQDMETEGKDALRHRLMEQKEGMLSDVAVLAELSEQRRELGITTLWEQPHLGRWYFPEFQVLPLGLG